MLPLPTGNRYRVTSMADPIRIHKMDADTAALWLRMVYAAADVWTASEDTTWLELGESTVCPPDSLDTDILALRTVSL